MLENLSLQPHDVCRDLFYLVPFIGGVGKSQRAHQQQQQLQQIGTTVNLPVGQYTLEWRRQTDDGYVDVKKLWENTVSRRIA